MTRVLLVLLLSAITAQCVPTCPASCVVCSDKAVICLRLTEIIDAPDTTEALLLTEGFISNVQSSSLSDLSNLTLIGLSHNQISALGKESFSNLTSLHTLLLDHNLLTSETLQGGVLTNLAHLEVLALGHNRISMIQADFLKGTETLRTLKLEGNLLTSLDLNSFPLRHLEDLNLSDNLINSLNKNSFHGLLGLRLLDLSRNRLTSTPPEAFSYLSGLTSLNLELNMWNCTCHLLELADFLTSFMQQPNKTLHNGRRLVCMSADNPALTTVLELTDANCVPPNQNITVRIESRNSVTPQMYARDVAIAAVICFIGGVSLTLLVVLIWYQASRRRKLKEVTRQREKEEEETGRGGQDAEKNKDNLNPVTGEEAPSPEARLTGQYWTREDDRNHYRCSNCRAEGTRMNLLDSRRNEGMEAKHEGRRVMREEGRRKLDIPNHVYSNGNASSHPGPYNTAVFQRNNEMIYRADVEGRNRHDTLRCENCHLTYRPPEGSRPGFPAQHRPNGNNQDRRYVSFDLESVKTLEKEAKYSEKGRGKSKRENEQEIDTKTKLHSGRSLKVKLNLSPLRKTRVHPKKKSEHSDKSIKSPNKSKDKRKGSKERVKKEDDHKKEKKSKKKGTPQNEKTESSKQPSNKETSETEESKTLPASVDTAQASPQTQTSRAESTVDHGPVPQHQRVGLAPGNWQGFPQHPSALSAFDQGQTTNLSLRRPGSNVSLQGGNFLLQHMANHGPQPGGPNNPSYSSLLSGGPTNAVSSLLPGGPTNAVSSLLPGGPTNAVSSLLPGGPTNATVSSLLPGGPTNAVSSLLSGGPTNATVSSLLSGGPTHATVSSLLSGGPTNAVSSLLPGGPTNAVSSLLSGGPTNATVSSLLSGGPTHATVSSLLSGGPTNAVSSLLPGGPTNAVSSLLPGGPTHATVSSLLSGGPTNATVSSLLSGGPTNATVSSLLPGGLTNVAVPSLLSGGQPNALLPSPTSPAVTSPGLPGLLSGGLNNVAPPLGGPNTSLVSSPTNPANASVLPGGITSPTVPMTAPTVPSVQGNQTNIVSTSQAAGSSPNLAAQTPVTQIQTVSQSPLPLDSPALVEVLKQSHGQGLQTEEGLLQGNVESQDQRPAGADAPVSTNQDESANTVETFMTNGGVVGTDVSVTGASDANVPPPGMTVMMDPALLQQEYLPEEGGSSPRRKLRLVLPEKTSGRPPTALERKIR